MEAGGTGSAHKAAVNGRLLPATLLGTALVCVALVAGALVLLAWGPGAAGARSVPRWLVSSPRLLSGVTQMLASGTPEVAATAAAGQAQQGAAAARLHRPEVAPPPPKPLTCGVYNNASYHLDVAAGIAWALQVRLTDVWLMPLGIALSA